MSAAALEPLLDDQEGKGTDYGYCQRGHNDHRKTLASALYEAEGQGEEGEDPRRLPHGV
jgi:hypothetical protein